MPKIITTRKELREAIGEAVGSVLSTAAIIGLALYFQSAIASYIGETLTEWLFVVLLPILAIICSLPAVDVIDGWLRFRKREVRLRKQKADDKRQQAEWQHQEDQERAEWDAFTIWVKQNLATAERLMCIVESEQIKDAEYRAWIAERRETEGPNVLTDLPRLFEWLKAQRDLKKFGLDTSFQRPDDE